MLHYEVVWRRLIKVSLGLVLGVLAAGVGYEQWSRHRAWEAFPPPGEMVEVDGGRMHLHCAGTGSPTVVIEAGLDAGGAFSWGDIQPTIAETTRVCSYNRGGILWSEPRERPRDGNRLTDELHALLETAGEAPPYVMVGHSMGGLLIRLFDLRFEGEVVGFVFVDSSHPEQFDRMPDAMRGGGDGGPSLLWTRIATAIGVARLSMPPARTPTNAAQAFAPQSEIGRIAESHAIVTIAKQTRDSRSLGDRPVVVVTAGDRRGDHEAWEQTWTDLQRELSELSTNADWRVARHAGHYVHLQDPQAVVTAIDDVVIAARDGTPVRKRPN